MKLFELHASSPDIRAIDATVKSLDDGGIAVIPTDTCYALACDALNGRAVERLCKLRGINPTKNTLSIICPNISSASDYARIDNRSFALLKPSLPGPFTFVLPAARSLPKVFNGRKSVGIRIPDNGIAIALAENLGRPLMVAGAYPEHPEAGAEESAMNYGDAVDIIIDGGDSAGVQSTVVDLTDSSSPQILRQGAGEW